MCKQCGDPFHEEPYRERPSEYRQLVNTFFWPVAAVLMAVYVVTGLCWLAGNAVMWAMGRIGF